MMELTQKRLDELLKAEQKLCALEAAGVDNWDGYDIAMEEISKEEEKEDLLDDFVAFIQEALLVEDVEIDQPAGVGAGYAINITMEGVRELKTELLSTLQKINLVDRR